jgi:TRAP-type uncharacterized transport system fused permease subunit
MLLTWKYTLPAFLVPFVFTLTPAGTGALLRGGAAAVAETVLTATLGVAALAGGCGGWIRQRATVAERSGLIAGGLLLMYAARPSELAGVTLTAVVLFLHFIRTSRQAGPVAHA